MGCGSVSGYRRGRERGGEGEDVCTLSTCIDETIHTLVHTITRNLTSALFGGDEH